MTTSPSLHVRSTPPYKTFLYLLFPLVILSYTGFSQQHLVESLKTSLGTAKDSTQYADRLNRISALSLTQHLDSCYRYAAAAQELSERIRYHKGLADAYMNLGAYFTFQNNGRLAHRFYLEGLQRYRNLGDSAGICQALYCIGGYYHYQGRTGLAIPYMNDAMAIGSRLWRDSAWAPMLANYYMVFAEDSLRQDSARWALHKARDIATRYHDDRMITYTGLFLAHERFRNGELSEAMQELRDLAAGAMNRGLTYLAVYAYAQLDIYASYARLPDSVDYRKKMLEAAVHGGYKRLMVRPVTTLYEYYKRKDPAEAMPYADIMCEIARHQEDMRMQGERNYMETFLQDQELKALRLHNALQEQTIATDLLENSNRKLLIIFLGAGSLLLAGLLLGYYRLYYNSRKKTRKLKEFNRLMSEKNRQLQHHDDFKNKLLSILAHDFRLPLSHIINVTELFKQKDIQAGQFREIAFSIASMANETLQLFETVLQWIKSQLSGFEYKPQPYVLRDLWNEAQEPLFTDIRDKALQIELHIPNGLTVTADKEMLQFVNRNLLHNAVKYSLRGGRIMIDASRDKDRVYVTVTNEGSGISANVIPYIFDYKAPGAFSQDSARGAGLALIICKDFMEKMKGSISVKSDGHTYTTFEYVI